MLYDAAGRQEYVVDALSRTNRFEYDAVGRLIKTIFADGRFTTNSFNLLGQRVAVKDQMFVGAMRAKSSAKSLLDGILGRRGQGEEAYPNLSPVPVTP